MVKKWEKNLRSIQKTTGINFDEILKDIQENRLEEYDVKPLSWYRNKYRLRIWRYRVIFDKIDWKNIVQKINSRWRIYKKL